MNTLESVLGMIRTEAFEAALEAGVIKLPPGPVFQYDLELLRLPDGTLAWVD